MRSTASLLIIQHHKSVSYKLHRTESPMNLSLLTSNTFQGFFNPFDTRQKLKLTATLKTFSVSESLWLQVKVTDKLNKSEHENTVLINVAATNNKNNSWL